MTMNKCDGCAYQPLGGESYRLRCTECSRWWPDLYQMPRCEACAHDDKTVGEAPCNTCVQVQKLSNNWEAKK
jgi:hypothetical protein